MNNSNFSNSCKERDDEYVKYRLVENILKQARVVADAYTGPLSEYCSPDIIYLEKLLDCLSDMDKGKA